jgi:riboflavin kinase/FMN adenylyltransferase
MKIYHNLNDFQPKGNAVVTTGTFDGVHLGHKKIIKRLIEKAKEIGGESVLLTFWPHPKLVLSPDSHTRVTRILSTIEEKTELLETLGLDHLVILPFTREFSELSCEKYIEDVLISGFGTKAMVIGYDHRFGKNREGGIDYLIQHSERFKIEIEEINRQEIDNITISSTKIRKAIEEGDIQTANELLGRNYDFCGTVVKGRQLGRQIGYPTANVQTQNEFKLIPKNGVYAVYAWVRGKKFGGVMNIGVRPTVEGKGITQEVYIFDFSDDIYGESVKVEIVDFIREEQKFDSIEALIQQIKQDVIASQRILQI